MSTIDYTPVILAQLTDLATRVTQLEHANYALRKEVQRLSLPSFGFQEKNPFASPVLGPTSHAPTPTTTPTHPFSGGFGFQPTPVQMSIPLASASASAMTTAPTVSVASAPTTTSTASANTVRKITPPPGLSAPAYKPKTVQEYRPMTIQDILHINEVVTIQVGVGRNDEGHIRQTTCVTVFDGVNLTVTNCELAPSLVGMSTSKPGEILYRFIEELKKGDHIKKTFTIAPWRLCFVVRNGKQMNLEELRGAF